MKAAPNERGVTWAKSRSGRHQIALKQVMRATGLEAWDVWTIRTGTHDIGPHTRRFQTEAQARAYANQLWRTA